MILLKLSFGKENSKEQKFEITADEMLNAAIDRALENVPKNGFKTEEMFVITVNGLMIGKEFWEYTRLKETDTVIISPKIGKGDSSQVFKQVLLIGIAIVSAVFLQPYGVYGAVGALAINIGASLLFNALIPPPVPSQGGPGAVSNVDNSQMYAITSQTNTMRRLGTVPKVYGRHRLFPSLAVIPYTELSTSVETPASAIIGTIKLSARATGAAGNGITIEFIGGGTAGAEVVGVSEDDITVTIAVGVSTAEDVVAALEASSAAMALVSVRAIGTDDSTQDEEDSKTLGGGTNAGEVVQYLYAIYDFGMGVMDVSDLKIGDTPVTSDSFKDFILRWVDPNRPVVEEDIYDARLEREFTSYKTKRVTSTLTSTLNTDGTEYIQFSDENTENSPQEIILDFVAPRGLYGYSSNGTTGSRSVVLHIDFAPVGTNDWKPYNDMSAVESFSSVGGTDETSYNRSFSAPTRIPSGASPYYVSQTTIVERRPSNNTIYSHTHIYVKPGATKILVPVDPHYQIGSKVFYQGVRFMGIITAVNVLFPTIYEIELDRVITNTYDLPLYMWVGENPLDTYNPLTFSPGGANPFYDIKTFTVNMHESSGAVITGSRAAPVYGSFRFTPLAAGQYQVRVRRMYATGSFVTQKEDNITWSSLTTAYKIDPINTTKRHCFLELKIRATDQLNGHIQNLSGVVMSVLPVYDPDTETWTRETTSNPAWIFCDLLTGEVNKKAVAISRLHMESISEWADYCDEVPSPPPGATYGHPRFTVNFVLDYEATLSTVLQQVTSTAQASLNIIDGKYGVLVDRLRVVPVQILTPRNSKDFSSSRQYGPRPHGVKVKYIDPILNWEVQELIVYDNGYDINTATEFDDLTAFAATNNEQAWRFGRYMIAQNKLRQETISITVDFENLVCTRGDYVQITQDVMRVGGRPSRVKEVAGDVITTDDAYDISPDLSYGYVYRPTNGDAIADTATLTPLTSRTFQVDGSVPSVGDLIVIGEVGSLVYDCIVKSIAPNDDLSAQLTLVEKADAIFEYESTDTLPDYDPQISTTSSPEFYPPKAVTNLEVGDSFWECNVLQSGYNYYVELVWDIPAGSVYEFFEIWVNDGRGYSKYDTTTSKLYRYDVVQSRLDIQHGFKVVAVAASGKKLELVAMPEVFATPLTKATAPSDVSALNMSITNQVLQLSWNAIDDCDVKEYVLRFSPESNDVWESSIPLVNVSRGVTSASVQARTGIYFIKAMDFNGNQSASPAAALTTIPNLFDLNIIEEMNDAPEFFGVKENIEMLGDAVVLIEEVPGDQDNVQYFAEGYYEFNELLDLDDIYSVRLQSLIRSDGLKKGELMSDWAHLSDIDHLNTALHSDWNVSLQYRASEAFSSMSDWAHLDEIDHINFGAGVGFTEWRDVPSAGDATGRIFQFRVKMESYTANVTPRVFDTTVSADMPDRADSFENLISSAVDAYTVSYDPVFKGPGTSPNVQISVDDGATGDYWTFTNKTLEGFNIRFYDKNGIQVSRQFDVVAKGYGRRHTATL